ncbi:sulfite exporter TauE/SafE family protein [Tomitella biformata]|uniref:sulfite exporter TauE/SafE family protein n=1 Tax=Tomitella biformata TaxID=630403 RepID=UPI0004BC11F4|nr:sulfite exporter TauE/SafE family protein [Tomitella biformata]
MSFASIIGGATGFGTALIATPLMLLAGIDVTDVVIVNLVVGLATRIAAVIQLRAHVEWRRVGWLGGASLPGAWLGVLTVALLPVAYLKPAVGALTVLCGLALAIQPSGGPRPPSRPALSVAGFVSGYFGTTTSLNGPPVVLLLGRAKLPPMSFIADLAGFFVITNTLSLALLWIYSDVGLAAIWPMLVGCLVVGLIGNRVGIAIAQRLSVGTFRWGVIALVLAAGILTIVTA